MDDDEYYQELMTKASSAVVLHSWQDCVEGFKQADLEAGTAFHRTLGWMNKAAEVYLSDNGKMAGFVGKFGTDCGVSYAYACQINQIRKDESFQDRDLKNFSHNGLQKLLSAPRELIEDFMSSEEPVKVKDVKQAKEGYKKVQEDPEYVDLLNDVKEKRKTPVNAAKEAWDRSEEKRKGIESRPNVFDLNAHIKSTEHCNVDVSATNLVVAMEQLISKFDKRDVMMYLYSSLQDDVLNIKIPALHKMSDILIELCEQLPLKVTTKQNVN